MHARSRNGYVSVAAAALWIVPVSPTAAEPWFEAFRPPWDAKRTVFEWISADGQTAAGHDSESVFRWTRSGGFEQWWDYGDLPVAGASADGRMLCVGGSGFAARMPAPYQFDLAEWFAVRSVAGITADGSTIVYTQDPTGGEGFLVVVIRSAGGSTLIYGSDCWPALANASALAMSDSGRIVGGDCGRPAEWWVSGGGGPIVIGEYDRGGLSAVSPTGGVIAGLLSNDHDQTLYVSTADPPYLGWPLDLYGGFTGVSDDGRLATLRTYRVDDPNQPVATIWTSDRGFARLEDVLSVTGILPAGWLLRSVEAVAPTKRIVVGSASDPNGVGYAFIARIPPRCPADRDWSGGVDQTDLALFLEAFAAGDPDADVDLSAFVDTDDFDAFVRAYESGC